jgi:replicative DNA helicase
MNKTDIEKIFNVIIDLNDPDIQADLLKIKSYLTNQTEIDTSGISDELICKFFEFDQELLNELRYKNSLN